MSKLIVPKMYSPEDIDKMVENEYLGFPAGFDESEMYNVLLDASRSQEFDNNPVMEILDVMSQPQYFYYTCKWLLNIHLLPFQVVMLQELWLRKFPMLLATRGGGKSFLLALYALLRAVFTQGSKIVVVGAAFRQSKLMFEYMEQLWRGAPILRNMVGDGKHQGPKRDIDRCTFYIGDSEVCAIPLGDGCCESNTLITNMNCFSYIKHSCEHVWGNGKFRYTDEHYDNGVKPTKIVKTKQGFSFEATLNHKMKVCRQRQIVWVRADEMVVGDRILIDRSVRWHNGKFECTEDEAYVVGALIGDGCWTNPYRLTFATMDKELSDCLQRIDSKWYQTDEAHWNRDGKEHKREWLEHWGLKDKCYAKDKVIPPTLLSAPRSCMTACLQGLFDTDGTIQISTKKGGTSVVIGFTNTSKELVRQMQYILLHYGIVAYVQERDRNVKWNRAYELLITGQDAVKFGEQIGFRLERKKVLLENALKDKIRTTVVGDTIPGVREEMMRIAKNHKVRGLGSVGYSKIAERKEITFQFAENFLHRYGAVQDPFIDELKQLCNRDIYYDTITSIEDSTAHTYDMHVPEDHEYCAGGFFSHNTKIRGLRAHYTLADEFACLDKDSLVETTNGLVRISDFERLNGEVLTGESNVSEYPSQFIKTPLCDVYQITLQNGYVIKCSENHKVMTHEGWKKPLELCDTDYVLRSDDTMVFGVSQPTNGRLIDILDSNGAFVMGDFYRHCATVEDKVPSDILQAPRDILTSFLCGLLNTDALESCTQFCSKSERLCRDVQVLMYKLGFEGAVHMNDSHFVWSRQFTVLTPYLKVESVVKLEHQDHLYDYHLPVAHCFYADGFKQHNSIPLEIFEVVIKGFASVSASPVQRTKDMARIKVLQSLGMYAEADDVDVGFGNQTVISGTAYYSFNHFYDYWKRYKQIIESRGDKRLLEEIFKGEVPEGFDWTQFSIFRVPWEKLPHGFMDETQIHQAKATVHRSTYMMEYEACALPTTPIITNNGIKDIIDVQVGDMVLTHCGRFRSVTKRTYRHYCGDILTYNTRYCYVNNSFTPEHPFWDGEKFVPLENMSLCTQLSTLREFSNMTSVFLGDFSKDYIDRDGYIYPRSGANKKSNEDVQEILQRYRAGESQSSISRDFNTTQSVIYNIINLKRPKTALRRTMKLDYHSGLVFGYYASEGSCGANGRAVAFSLDGHVDKSLLYYVDELSYAIYHTFGVKPKRYVSQFGDVCNVTVNSRVLVDVIKSICPGICYDKMMKHDILFSNKEFLRGFIVGMFHGDGHVGVKFATISLTNINLLNQLRLALSAFGINSSIRKPNKLGSSYIRGKLVKSTQQYKLDLHGDNYRMLINLIQNNISSVTPDCLEFKDYQVTRQHYDGYVYNLEVAEDNSYSTLNATVHNCFSRDSDGFFKRSLIESCVCKSPIDLPSGPVQFSAVIRGNPNCKYVYGIDPASEKDNFAIIILEIHPDHRRIVYAWSINRQKLRERIKQGGKTTQKSFYTYCARKIRDLMRLFPTDHIAIDTQGGGIAIMEALHDPDEFDASRGEKPLWPYIRRGENDVFWWEQPNKPTDGEAGLHNLHMVQFANADFTRDANHFMRKDFESKTTLFPMFDPATISEAISLDKIHGRDYDTLEDCVMDIEELKDELATIIHDQTAAGRDRWDTPEVKLPGNKKGRLRKDRYSALLIANMVAHVMEKQLEGVQHEFVGGFAGQRRRHVTGRHYIGPEHIVSKMQCGHYGKGVSRQ